MKEFINTALAVLLGALIGLGVVGVVVTTALIGKGLLHKAVKTECFVRPDGWTDCK